MDQKRREPGLAAGRRLHGELFGAPAKEQKPPGDSYADLEDTPLNRGKLLHRALEGDGQARDLLTEWQKTAPPPAA
ncbi:hypothetical protein [Streptomyces sp. NPDC058155]|uniref:hypothetical protein n=1 Tax=Streptomyces sp. NPDC058155 TaxID=3346359 RepID=UPI0036E80799